MEDKTKLTTILDEEYLPPHNMEDYDNVDETEDGKEVQYIPFGSSEILVDETDINYTKASLYQTIITNNLLGFFDETGDYDIPFELVSELIEIPKKLDERIGNTAYADTEVNGHFLRFKVEFSSNSGQSDAKLFIVEKVKDRQDFDSITTFLTMFTLASEAGFMDKAYLEFNINAETSVLDIESYKNLKKKFDVMEGNFGYNLILLELLSQDYISRLKALLEKLGGKGSKILEEFNAELAKLIEKKKLTANNFIAIKNLLDQIMRKHDGFNFILRENRYEAENILNSMTSTIDGMRKEIDKGVLAGGGQIADEEAAAEKEKKAKEEKEIKLKFGSASKSKSKKVDPPFIKFSDAEYVPPPLPAQTPPGKTTYRAPSQQIEKTGDQSKETHNEAIKAFHNCQEKVNDILETEKALQPSLLR